MDFSSLALASYMIELSEVLFPLGVADANMFELLKSVFYALDKDGPHNALRIIFEGRAMALGGFGIDLKKCSLCGRHYEGEGRAVFVREKGAIACLKCVREDALSPGLDPSSVKALERIQKAATEKFNGKELSHEGITEIRLVLKLHMEYRLGQRLKTGGYLD
jgi:DNA repair protein RecO (recombination protein O)